MKGFLELLGEDSNVNGVFKKGVVMGAVKEKYLNNIPNEEMVLSEEQRDLVSDLVSDLVYHVEIAVKDGVLESDYANYLICNPMDGVEWLAENMGVRLI
jgi:hypothetical protein